MDKSELSILVLLKCLDTITMFLNLSTKDFIEKNKIPFYCKKLFFRFYPDRLHEIKNKILLFEEIFKLNLNYNDRICNLFKFISYKEKYSIKTLLINLFNTVHINYNFNNENLLKLLLYVTLPHYTERIGINEINFYEILKFYFGKFIQLNIKEIEIHFENFILANKNFELIFNQLIDCKIFLSKMFLYDRIYLTKIKMYFKTKINGFYRYDILKAYKYYEIYKNKVTNIKSNILFLEKST